MNLEGLRPSPEIRSPVSDFQFAMEASGFALRRDGAWEPNRIKAVEKDLEPFGYMFRSFAFDGWALANADLQGVATATAFAQKPVLDIIRKYRDLDEDEARRISFLVGYTARFLKQHRNAHASEIAKATAFTASMTGLGQRRSGEAIAAAMAMHILSGGSLEDDPVFKGDVYHMAEAITEDPIIPWETEDLGISQARRLLRFVRKMHNAQDLGQPVAPAIAQYRETFAAFPTIGAEFHIPGDEEMNGTFWQRIAILNMAQYQSGSQIPFSRNDEGLVEIRMDPSIYPVAISTWKLMRLLLPEVNRSYFTMTINRKQTDFDGKSDEGLIMHLHAMGNLCYAAFFDKVPSVTTPKQVNFGDRYLGQTVRVTDGKYNLTGNWGRARGEKGQLNICTGYGDLFPDLAFYLSMVLADPTLPKPEADYIKKATTLKEAVKMRKEEIWNVFAALNTSIMDNPRLIDAVEYGERIMEELKP